MPDAVFVYGTLMPGRLRWHLLAPPTSTSYRPATAAGSLWDTGNGWPAARFTDADTGSIVPGWLVEIDRALLHDVLVVLDEVEGAIAPMPDGTWPERDDERVPPGDYRRLVVRTADGAQAWAYEALIVDPTWTPIVAWADQLER